MLQRLQAEAKEYPERHSQLAAIRFYLHYILWQAGQGWRDEVVRGHGSNYEALLDRIQRWRKAGETIWLVTFNYDILLEAALPTVGVRSLALSDYVSGDTYKIVKLHGSVNWAREINTPIDMQNRNTWQVLEEIIDRVAELDISDRFTVVSEYPIGKGERSALYPAIAIPLEEKNEYECPPDHIEALRASLPHVTKLLLIGWRATEAHFLRLLAEHLQPNISTMVVSGSPEATKGPIERLASAGVDRAFVTASGGFTDLVLGDEVDEFLKSGG